MFFLYKNLIFLFILHGKNSSYNSFNQIYIFKIVIKIIFIKYIFKKLIILNFIILLSSEIFVFFFIIKFPLKKFNPESRIVLLVFYLFDSKGYF